MGKVVRLTESDLIRLVKKVIEEQSSYEKGIWDRSTKMLDKMEKGGNVVDNILSKVKKLLPTVTESDKKKAKECLEINDLPQLRKLLAVGVALPLVIAVVAIQIYAALPTAGESLTFGPAMLGVVATVITSIAGTATVGNMIKEMDSKKLYDECVIVAECMKLQILTL